MKKILKSILKRCFPAFRVSLRIEEKLDGLLHYHLISNIANKDYSLTAVPEVYAACFALEVHEAHQNAFHEYKNCHMNDSVVMVATGPTMKYYRQIEGAYHIGMNAAFKNENVKLDYYFTTDYASRNEWFDELKNYDFVKFFGQYSPGIFRETFQVTEKLMIENNAKKFFQGAPNEDIPYNIEFYPLAGFYTIALQALQFAVWTYPKKIYLVGCDCSNAGYFDGSKQLASDPQMWIKGYKKMKDFVERFYPGTEIISINPVGLKGVFHDVYTEDYLNDHPEIDKSTCEIIDLSAKLQ